jgi:hypothetical protein
VVNTTPLKFSVYRDVAADVAVLLSWGTSVLVLLTHYSKGGG